MYILNNGSDLGRGKDRVQSVQFYTGILFTALKMFFSYSSRCSGNNIKVKPEGILNRYMRE